MFFKHTLVPERPLLLVLIVWVAAAAGCPGVQAPLERPVVSVRELAVAATADRSLEVRAELAIYNPNSFALTARAFDWHLAIGPTEPVRGRSDVTARLAGRSTTAHAIVLDVPAGAAASMSAWLASGARDYHLRGMLHVLSARNGSDVGVVVDTQGAISGR